MSFIPPDFDSFPSVIHTQLDHLKKRVSSSTDERVRKAAHDCFSFLEEETDKKSLYQDAEKFKDFYLESAKKLKQLAIALGVDKSADHTRQLAEETFAFHSDLRSTYEALTHKEQIAKKGIEPFLDQPWARAIFVEHYNQNSKWMSQVAQKLENENPALLFEILVHKSTQEGASQKLFIALLEKCNCSEFIKTLFTQSTDKQESEQKQLLFLRLIQNVKAHLQISLYKQLFNLFKEYPCMVLIDHFAFYFSTLTQKNDLLDLFFYELQAATSSHLRLFQFTLLEIGGVSVEDSFFLQSMKEKLLNPSYAPSLLAACMHTRFPISAKKVLSQLTEELNESSSFEHKLFYALQMRVFFYNEYLNILPLYSDGVDSHTHFFILKELLKRERNLVLFFTQQLPKPDTSEEQFSEGFERYGQIVLGTSKEFKKITQEVLRLLHAKGMPTLTLSSHGGESEFGGRVIQKEPPTGLWMRDNFYSTPFKLVAQPCSFSIQDFEEDVQKSKFVRAHARDHSIKPEYTFGGMGQTFHSAASLYTLNALKEVLLDLPNDRSIFQFIRNEGGNVLKGKNYAVIGLDSFQFAMHHTQLDLLALGLVKDDAGNWSLSLEEPDQVPDINEEDLIELFRYDLGCQDVFFVEQPAYHLDVACSIVDPDRKVVWVNDSVEAAEADLALFYSRVDQKKLRPAKREIYEERERLYRLKALHAKKYEDLCAEDFEKHGFTVHRKAGVRLEFDKDSPDLHQANLFNKLAFEAPNGQKVLLCPGACEEIQSQFLNELRAQYGEEVEILFLDAEMSKQLLSKSGAIRCMTQGINLETQ